MLTNELSRGRDSCHKAGYKEGKITVYFCCCLYSIIFCIIQVADDVIFLAAEQGAIVIRRGQAIFTWSSFLKHYGNIQGWDRRLQRKPKQGRANWTHGYFQVCHGPAQAMTLTALTHWVLRSCDDVTAQSCEISHIWSCPLHKTSDTRTTARLGLHCLHNKFLINTQGKRLPPCWNMAYGQINGTYLFPNSQTLQIYLSYLIIASVPPLFQNEGICKIRKGEGREQKSTGFSVTMVLKVRQYLPW